MSKKKRTGGVLFSLLAAFVLILTMAFLRCDKNPGFPVYSLHDQRISECECGWFVR